VDWLYSHVQSHSDKINQNLSNLDLKLLTNSANTTPSGKLFHIRTIVCQK